MAMDTIMPAAGAPPQHLDKSRDLAVEPGRRDRLALTQSGAYARASIHSSTRNMMTFASECSDLISAAATKIAPPIAAALSRESRSVTNWFRSGIRELSPSIAEATAMLKAWVIYQGNQSYPVGAFSKRVLDVTIACAALIVAAPLLVLVAILMKLTDSGPVLFSQLRVGYNGVPFRCYKFRTMVVNSSTVLQQHLASDPTAAREWAENQKLTIDPRVTPLGALLRKSSVDELPQLFNVLRNDMSCVGPRPIVQAEIARYGEHAQHYMRARPGLTGMWQVSGRSKRSYSERIALDCYYVRKWSFWLDVMILAKTIPAVLRTGETA